jgi:hypothetical protein
VLPFTIEFRSGNYRILWIESPNTIFSLHFEFHLFYMNLNVNVFMIVVNLGVNELETANQSSVRHTY